MFLIAVSQSYAEKPAATDGKQALIGLPAAAESIILGMKPCVYSRFRIVCEKYQRERRGGTGAGYGGKPFYARAGYEYHYGTDKKYDYRSGHMVLENRCSAYDADDDGREKNAVFEGFYLG